VRVKDLGTRPAPASIREMLSRLARGHGPATVIQRRQIPYWQDAPEQHLPRQLSNPVRGIFGTDHRAPWRPHRFLAVYALG